MRSIFVDTGFIIALESVTDQNICCKIKMEKVAKQKWRKLQLEIP